jgi:hypothetical protein
MFSVGSNSAFDESMEKALYNIKLNTLLLLLLLLLPEENWADWSAAFTEAFRKRYTMDDWKAAVAARVQQPGESAAHYAHDKAKFHRLCPEPMSERAFVGHLISGIKHTQLYWHLHNANLATIAAFVTEYGRLEVVASTAPPVIDPLQGELAPLRTEMEAVRRAQVNNMPRFSTRISPTTVPSSRTSIDRATGTGVFRYTLQFII